MTVSTHPLFVQGITNYTADEFRTFLDAAFPVAGVLRSGLVVSPTGPVTMGVLTGTGYAIVPAKSGSNKRYLLAVTAPETTVLNVGSGSNPRIDVIVAEVDDVIAGGDASDTAKIAVVQGTPSGSPVAPTLTNNQLPLAYIAVSAAATTVVAGNITDKRVNAGRPGEKILQAQQTTVQALAANTATTLTNFTADFASDAGFSATTGVYTSPVAQVVEVWGSVVNNGTPARTAILVIKNGTIITQNNSGSGSGAVSAASVPFQVALAAGDTLAIQGFFSSAVSTISAAGNRSLFAIRRVD